MFSLKKNDIKESRKLIEAAIADDALHVYGSGPKYQIKFDIWIIGYAEFKNGEIVFTPRPDGKQLDNFKDFISEMKRKYRKK